MKRETIIQKRGSRVTVTQRFNGVMAEQDSDQIYVDNASIPKLIEILKTFHRPDEDSD